MTSLAELLHLDRPLLADGATGTNLFEMGLGPGEPPELWNVDHPERVVELHQGFVSAGADIILTNTFGCNRKRLQLHRAEDRVFELASAAARLARQMADAADRPVVVAGSVGPTGELLEPLGPLTEPEAVEVFTEQMEGLRDGGVDVAWIETKSAVNEMRSAAQAAIAVGLPYTVTASFDTAGRTMMGLTPADLPGVFAELAVPPLAVGANCGVGAPDLVVAVTEMHEHSIPLIAKSNCGIPQFQGTEVVYSGDPELMGRYAGLAIDAGARIIGGCCGTSATHLAEMRRAVDAHTRGPVPSVDDIVERIGPLTNRPPAERSARSRRRRGS